MPTPNESHPYVSDRPQAPGAPVRRWNSGPAQPAGPRLEAGCPASRATVSRRAASDAARPRPALPRLGLFPVRNPARTARRPPGRPPAPADPSWAGPRTGVPVVRRDLVRARPVGLSPPVRPRGARLEPPPRVAQRAPRTTGTASWTPGATDDPSRRTHRSCPPRLESGRHRPRSASRQPCPAPLQPAGPRLHEGPSKPCSPEHPGPADGPHLHDDSPRPRSPEHPGPADATLPCRRTAHRRCCSRRGCSQPAAQPPHCVPLPVTGQTLRSRPCRRLRHEGSAPDSPA